MTSLAFAWRRLTRQPGRAMLGVLGIAAVGALLFDMLLLSRGLVVSLAERLDRVGFDVRVTTGDLLPIGTERIPDASHVVETVSALPEVARARALRIASGWALWPQLRIPITLVGSAAGENAGWRVIEGRPLTHPSGSRRPVLVSRSLSVVTEPSIDLTVTTVIGDTVTLRGDCLGEESALPPLEFEVVGVAEFPFDGRRNRTVAVSLADLIELCGEVEDDTADVLLVASRPEVGPLVTARAVGAALPALYAFGNQELVDRFQTAGFAYFRQISAVLATVTLFFGFLLITTLLTVSVNQRVTEIATMRAMGFPRRRVVTDLLLESTMLVGAGGLLALPLGFLLAWVLDDILRSMPGLPADLRFFVFQARALWWHVGLLAATAALAAVYPARLATRLPIAATLRDEVVS